MKKVAGLSGVEHESRFVGDFDDVTVGEPDEALLKQAFDRLEKATKQAKKNGGALFPRQYEKLVRDIQEIADGCLYPDTVLELCAQGIYDLGPSANTKPKE
jgi:hypothetical protein